jgi:hypothetical protein
MPQGSQQPQQPSGAPDVLGGGPWTDLYTNAMNTARGWEQTVRDGGTVDTVAARQQFQDLISQIHTALDDPNLSQLGSRSLSSAAYQLYASGNIAGVVHPGDLPADALGVLGSGRTPPGLPRR